MEIKKVRDLTLVALDKDKTLLITCDTCGSIGEKEHDVLKIPPYYTGKFTARVALMEILATGAEVVGIVNGVCCEMEPTGQFLLKGILEELKAANIAESVLTGSTEENFPVSTTALAITAIGIGEIKKLRINNLENDIALVAVGIPKVGAEIGLELDCEIIQYPDLFKLIDFDAVLEIVPVGSHGIQYELENLCNLNSGYFVQEKGIKIDLEKSAGPATVLIAGIKKSELSFLQSLDAPVTLLGHFFKDYLTTIKVGKKKIIVKQGDITEERTDAIINPANGHLAHGGGAAAAIVNAGGKIIQEESNQIIKEKGFLATGEAVITGSGKLFCQYVIHTVGPRMGEGDEPAKLRQAVWNALFLAEEHQLHSISLPSISSGIFGFPKDKCAEILLQTSIDFLQQKANYLQIIVMCNRDKKTCEILGQKAKQYRESRL